VEEGYIVTGTAGTISFSGSATEQLTTVNGQTIAPTESVQTAVPALRFTKGAVKIGAIPADYVGSGVTQRSSSDLTANGATVTAPAGYYSAAATKTVASGTEGTPVATKSAVNNHAVTVTPSVVNTAGYITGGTKTGTAVTVSASDLVSGTLSITQNTTGRDVTNYQKVDVAIPAPVLETVTTTYTPTTSQQTSTITASTGYDAIGQVNVTVDAVPTASLGVSQASRSKTATALTTRFDWPNFVAGYMSSHPPVAASQILQNETVTPTTTAQTVTPTSNGYYLESVTVEAMPAGTAGTPTATKGAVSGHAVTVTPSVTNATGYITGGTITGTAVTVSASELVSGSQTITTNDTYDVTNLAEVVVSVSGGSPSLQAKTNINPTTSSQTITADAGYDGLSSVQINAMPSGTEGTPTATKGTVTNHSISVTPSVTNAAGYISGGTHNGTAVTVSASELVSGTLSITSSGTKDVTNYASASVASGSATASATKGTVSNHSITVTPSVTKTAGYITAGTTNGTAVTVSASELVSGSETKTSNGTYDVTNLAELVVNVSGGGGSLSYDTKTATASNYPTSLSFTGMKGAPKFFAVRLNAQVSSSGSTTYYYIVEIISNCNGTSAVTHGNCFRIGSTRRVDNITSGYSYSYSGTTLTITSSAASRSASPGAFYSGSYELIYAY
jgi:epidermal growth factor receptor substrate 15